VIGTCYPLNGFLFRTLSIRFFLLMKNIYEFSTACYIPDCCTGSLFHQLSFNWPCTPALVTGYIICLSFLRSGIAFTDFIYTINTLSYRAIPRYVAHSERERRITCQRGSARQCCKGHVSFLWEKPIFDPSQKPNPLTYNHKNLHD
jgi:hypothetical protein